MNARSYELAGGWSSVMKPSGPSVVNVTAMLCETSDDDGLDLDV